MTEKFVPTHILRIGTGEKRAYWKVQIIGPIGRDVNGDNLYNAIPSTRIRNESGMHFINNIPESRLRPIKQKEGA